MCAHIIVHNRGTQFNREDNLECSLITLQFCLSILNRFCDIRSCRILPSWKQATRSFHWHYFSASFGNLIIFGQVAARAIGNQWCIGYLIKYWVVAEKFQFMRWGRFSCIPYILFQRHLFPFAFSMMEKRRNGFKNVISHLNAVLHNIMPAYM